MKWIQLIFIGINGLSMNLDAQGNLHWHNGMTFDATNAKKLAEYRSSEIANGKYFRVLQFNHILDEAEKLSMSNDGITILEYVPDNLYLVSIDPFISRAKNNLFGLIASFELSKSHKLSKQLLHGDPCMKEASKSLMVIKFMKGIDIKEIEETLSNQNISTDRFYPKNQLFYAKLDLHQIEWLVSLAWIQFIDCESTPGVPEDREGRSLHRVNLIGSNPKENLFLEGNGVKVMVRDDGFVGPHIDFEGRIHQDVRDDSEVHHADGVSGILAGAGNYDPLVEGMAPGAELYTLNYQPDFLDKTLDYHQQEGVVITNTSYSNGCNAGYTIEAQVVDKQLFENPQLIHVFSAGNSNGLDCGYGAGNQWGNVTGGHKIGKNALTVANLRLDGTLETSSSRGPTKDGRLKPEISARGTNELSTAPGNGTQVFGGTSAAAPGVAGVCALLYEAYKNFHNGQNPESSLIKAAIMNTATDIGTPGPDYQFGFGVIDAYKAYKLLTEKRYNKLSILHQQVLDSKVTIPVGSNIAKFMIYWAEPEASLLASKALINNLDMEVIDPLGATHKSWVLNPTPDIMTLAKGASKGLDTLNNFEQVSILSPIPGVYTIRIKGSFLPSNRVDFYLLHEYEDKLLRLSYPLGGEKFNITESTQVHYTSYGTDSIVTLFSSDAGLNWQILGVQQPGSRLQSIFIPNNLSSDSCLVEVVQGNEKDRSDFFTITNGVQGFKINKFCPDEITLNWKRTSKDSFRIYQLGQKYMDPIATTSDTFITFSSTDPRIKKWYSIAAFDKTILSNRELAISTPDTLIGCGITKDLALSVLASGPLEYYSCGQLNITPNLKVINRTNSIQSGFTIKAYSKNKIVEQIYTASINPYDTLDITFNTGIVIENFGMQLVTAWIEFDQDENSFNDTIFITVNAIELPEKNGKYPMIESFSGSSIPPTWLQKNESFDSRWNVVNVIGRNNQLGNALMYGNTNSIYNSFPVTLVSQTADLTNAIEPFLYLDFAQHHFLNNIYFDSIRIKVKQVCGTEHKVKVLLSGTSTEINTVEPTTSNNWQPLDSSWFWLAYDLSEFKGSKVIIEFEIIRGRGDRTFLDNVEIRERLPGTGSADFNINPFPACYTKQVTFNDSSSILGTHYSWDVGMNGVPRFYFEKGPFKTKYTLFGMKRVMLKIKSDINNDAIIIKDLPLANTPVVNYTYQKVSERTIKFTNTSANAVTYLWDFGDGSFSSEVNPIHTFDSAKIYRVKLTITSPCGTYMRSINIDLTITSTIEKNKDLILEIFPNPTSNDVIVKSSDLIISYKLFSAEGKMVLHQEKVNATQTNILMNEVISGIYTLRVVTDKRLISRKIEKR